MSKRYFVNPLAVLFHPELDRKNSYNTIVRNPTTEEILKVNPFGYDILRTIDENPGTDIETVTRLIAQKRGLISWQVETKIAEFIRRMVKENIVFEK